MAAPPGGKGGVAADKGIVLIVVPSMQENATRSLENVGPASWSAHVRCARAFNGPTIWKDMLTLENCAHVPGLRIQAK